MTNIKWSISGGSQFSELGYRYNGIEWVIIWNPNKVIDIGRGVVELLRQSVREVCSFILIKSLALTKDRSKTSLNLPTMGPTINGPFKEVISSES